MRRSMDRPLPPPGLDRREFINGHWTTRETGGPGAEIASILVQVRRERLDAAAQAIEALPGAQIHTRGPKVNLVAVIEEPAAGAIGTTLNASSLMPDVLTAALVFHGTDEG